jgi:ABC-type transport system involved in multi-copper enzyme maturation permease subunit
MQKALKIEWIKFKSHPIYPILLCTCLLLYVIIVGAGTGRASNSNSNLSVDSAIQSLGYMQRGIILQSLSYTAGFFKYIFVIIFMLYISLDSKYKIYRKQSMEGWSRNASFFSKYIWILAFIFFKVLLIYILGFSMASNGDGNWNAFLHYPFLWAVEFGILMSLGMLIIQLSKSAGISIIILLVYSIIVEPLLSYKLKHLQNFLPLTQSRLLIEAPFKRDISGFFGAEYQTSGFPIFPLIISLVFIIAFTLLSRIRFLKSDL